ncbi:putative methyltransferase PMT28 [Hibiscus syriacus]|uniref:Methyltransferase n=1 Tax=Hibiscus syriacus TaxID=106335 RepID=A0A6A3BT54_HIBSY|nr:putative methyltransferase PMT28 [Hibiscus syriacus]
MASLFDKDVLTLTLGLKDDLVDLAQVSLERGFATVVSPFARRRLSFPSGVFDAIHCGQCTIPWHSHEGKLLEINRILRPGGYFILSTKHDSIEAEEAMNTLTSSICWNILAHKTDDVSDVGVKIYQKPDSNDIYVLRRRKNPPLCKEHENPDSAWYVPMKTCLHTIPSVIEQHGTEWPEEWPKSLETYPEWLNNKEKAIDDTKHWKNIVDKSYLTGMGIDWSTIRNVMDMKAIYGGFAAALLQQKIWVMNVVPIHAPDTLPFIFERELVGVYHDWCEPFGTYPRSYDLLHADHFFSRLKNRLQAQLVPTNPHVVQHAKPKSRAQRVGFPETLARLHSISVAWCIQLSLTRLSTSATVPTWHAACHATNPLFSASNLRECVGHQLLNIARFSRPQATIVDVKQIKVVEFD